MAVTCGVAHLTHTGKQITAGQRVACVSEDRLAPYVHDRHRADHGVYARCWRCAMNSADGSSGGLPRLVSLPHDPAPSNTAVTAECRLTGSRSTTSVRGARSPNYPTRREPSWCALNTTRPVAGSRVSQSSRLEEDYSERAVASPLIPLLSAGRAYGKLGTNARNAR